MSHNATYILLAMALVQKDKIDKLKQDCHIILESIQVTRKIDEQQFYQNQIHEKEKLFRQFLHFTACKLSMLFVGL